MDSENKSTTFKFKISIWEYERGWGSRLDDVKEFDTAEEADAFIINFNSKNNEEEIPDWYMVASRNNYGNN